MGTVIVPRPEQCGTIAKTSEWERAGPKLGGRGATPRDSLRPGFSRESLDPRPGPGGNHPQGLTCAGPNQDHLPMQWPQAR